MGAIASQITSLTIVYSTVYSGADQSKHQSSAALAFVWGIHRGPMNSPHKWPVTRKMFPFDDVIMYATTLAAIVLFVHEHNKGSNRHPNGLHKGDRCSDSKNNTRFVLKNLSLLHIRNMHLLDQIIIFVIERNDTVHYQIYFDKYAKYTYFRLLRILNWGTRWILFRTHDWNVDP